MKMSVDGKVVEEMNEEGSGRTASDDIAAKLKKLDHELKTALTEFSQMPEQTAKMQNEFYRKRNALYSQRKYYRMRHGFASLTKKKRKLLKSNTDLKAEHERLKTLISIANSVVESISMLPAPANAPEDKNTDRRMSSADQAAAPVVKPSNAAVMERLQDGVPGCFPTVQPKEGYIPNVNVRNDALKPLTSQASGAIFYDTQLVSDGELQAQRMRPETSIINNATNCCDGGEVSVKMSNHLLSPRVTTTSALYSPGQVPPSLPARQTLAQKAAATHMSMGPIMNSDRSWQANFSPPLQKQMPCTSINSQASSDHMVQPGPELSCSNEFCDLNGVIVQRLTKRPNSATYIQQRRPFNTCFKPSSTSVYTPGKINMPTGIASIRSNVPVRSMVQYSPSPNQEEYMEPEFVFRGSSQLSGARFEPRNDFTLHPPTQVPRNITHRDPTVVHPAMRYSNDVGTVVRKVHQRSINASALNPGNMNLVPLNTERRCRLDNLKRLQEKLNHEIEALSSLPEMSTPVYVSMDGGGGGGERLGHHLQPFSARNDIGQFSQQQQQQHNLVAQSRLDDGLDDGSYVGNQLLVRQHHSSYPATTIGLLPNNVRARSHHLGSVPSPYYRN